MPGCGSSGGGASVGGWSSCVLLHQGGRASTLGIQDEVLHVVTSADGDDGRRAGAARRCQRGRHVRRTFTATTGVISG